MGLFDLLGDRNADQNTGPREEPDGAMAQRASVLVEKLLSIGFDGSGKFDSAHEIAAAAQRRRSDPERVIDDIVAQHTRLAATSGFVTGLGGFALMVVALPANVAGFYVLATRMAAAIAKVRGFDIDDPAVRSAILLSLVGSDADDILAKAGAGASGPLANVATKRLPSTAVMAINKGVGFRLLTQLSGKTLGRLGRAVPLVGGLVGATFDGFYLTRIARHVRDEFPAAIAGEIEAKAHEEKALGEN
ncbi:MAG: EcsC family protein [Dermatophilus congolensis]|nr:EcsC family protein [Dermatophilus congolensis]